jgi:hypothetical protein
MEEMINSYLLQLDSSNFTSAAFDLFLETPQKNHKVEEFRRACEDWLHDQAIKLGHSTDFWASEEGATFVAEQLRILTSGD